MIIYVLVLIYFGSSLGEVCNWSNWSDWSECTGNCGGKQRERTRNCLCPDSTDNTDIPPDCSGPEKEYDTCTDDCVRPFEYWKWHHKYTSETVFFKPWPISEDTLIGCSIGYDPVRVEMSWYNVTGHSENDKWVLLTQQYIAAKLNIQSGASSHNILTPLNEAAEIISNCDEWTPELFNRSEQLIIEFRSYNTGQMGVNLCQEKPCCVFNGWGPWGECTAPCEGGLSYRYEQCFCPAFLGGTPDDSWCYGEQGVDTTPCNTESCTETVEEKTEQNDDQSMKCYWNEWGPWTDCSSDCYRTREALCYCNNEANDNSFCDGVPPIQSEPCYTNLCTKHKPIEFWRANNCYGSGDYYQPWPIPETTLFNCDSGSNSQYSQMNWLEILNVKETTDIWITLAQVYILIELNIAHEEVEAPLQEVLTHTNSLLNHCERFTDSDKAVAGLLAKVLKDYCETGKMNTSVLTLDEVKSSLGFNTQEMGSPPMIFSPTLISLVSLGAVIALISIILFFLWRKGKSTSDNIVTLEPEFDLPDPDEELVPGNTEILVTNGEEETLSYELGLGELDEVDMI